MDRNAAFLSVHAYESRRRAGFHWLADAYARAGWRVDFVTVGLSPLSLLRMDYRLEFARTRGVNRSFAIAPGLYGYYWFQPFHPVNLRSVLANRFAAPWFRLYARLPFGTLAPILRDAQRVIIESSLALAFVPRLRKLAPQARCIYRVSDDVAVIGAHPVLSEFERAATPCFDLISIPSDRMRRKFPPGAPVAVHHHGIEKAFLDVPHPDPYPRTGRRKVLSMGTTLFDAETFLAFAAACPEVDFHLFGAIEGLPARPNIVLHGERPFRELAPYIQHADAGFAPYRWTPGCEYLLTPATS